MNELEQRMDDILKRIAKIEKNVSRVKNRTAYNDLRDMVARANGQVTEMSREGVICRQTKRITIRYKELDKNLDSIMYNIEKHITYALLKN